MEEPVRTCHRFIISEAQSVGIRVMSKATVTGHPEA